MDRVVIACVALVLLAPGRGFAQRSEEQALRQATALASAGEHAAAARVLRRAQIDTPSPQVDLNLALSLAELGRLRQARELLRRVIASDANPLLVEAARERLRAVEARLPRVTIRVGRGAAELQVDSETITVDGPVVRLELDPGTHRIALRDADGAIVARRRVELAPAERVQVTMRSRRDRSSRRARAATERPEVSVELAPAERAEATPRSRRDRPARRARAATERSEVELAPAERAEVTPNARRDRQGRAATEGSEVALSVPAPQPDSPADHASGPLAEAMPATSGAGAGLAHRAEGRRDDTLVWLAACAGAAAVVIGVVVAVAVVAAQPSPTMSDVPPVWVGR